MYDYLATSIEAYNTDDARRHEKLDRAVKAGIGMAKHQQSRASGLHPQSATATELGDGEYATFDDDTSSASDIAMRALVIPVLIILLLAIATIAVTVWAKAHPSHANLGADQPTIVQMDEQTVMLTPQQIEEIYRVLEASPPPIEADVATVLHQYYAPEYGIEPLPEPQPVEDTRSPLEQFLDELFDDPIGLLNEGAK